MNIRAYNTSLNVGAYSIYAHVFLKKKKKKSNDQNLWTIQNQVVLLT